MGVVVAFDYSAWSALFPEFSTTVTEPQADALFAAATVLHRNDGGGPVSIAQIQTTALNYVVAHLAFLQYGTNDSPGGKSGAVGRLSSATEGSVSAQFDYGEVTKSEAFWVQSQYGAFYWQMTAPYRTARYLPNPCQLVPPFYLTGRRVI